MFSKLYREREKSWWHETGETGRERERENIERETHTKSEELNEYEWVSEKKKGKGGGGKGNKNFLGFVNGDGSTSKHSYRKTVAMCIHDDALYARIYEQ